MCVLETLSHKLSVQSASMQAGSKGKPEITACDLAGMLAGLDRGPVSLAYAKLVADEGAARMVYAILHRTVAEWALIEEWKVPRGSERLGNLARMVRDDLVLTRPMLSGRSAAKWIGVSEKAWRNTWKDRHGRLLDIGLAWECELRRKLKREIYGSDDQ